MTLTKCEAQLTRNDWTAGGISWYYIGRPTIRNPSPDKIFDRFLSKISIVGECWEWQAARNEQGYGRFNSGLLRPSGKSLTTKASRYSLSIKLGRDILPGLLALHFCHNPPCVRPDHLREGTYSENTFDAVRRGTHPSFLLAA